MNARPIRSVAAGTLAILSLAVPAIGGLQNGVSAVARSADCAVDLSVTGAMADVLSNALTLGLGIDERTVAAFLEDSAPNSETGTDFLVRAATAFGVDRDALARAVERYRHVNCSHPGGGAEREFGQSEVGGARELDWDFAESVLRHVVLHELAHALVREFDLPVLANEETLADAFATHFLVTQLPEQAPAVLLARVESLMFEASEVPRAEWTVTGEHDSDARRAYQIAALAIAEDMEAYAFLAPIVGMGESEMASAADYGTEIHRSWRRILRPLRMPAGRASSEVRLQVDERSFVHETFADSDLLADLESALRSFDWHSRVTLRFESGDGGAAWSRSSRTITVHDQYIERFARQGQQVIERSTSP